MHSILQAGRASTLHRHKQGRRRVQPVHSKLRQSSGLMYGRMQSALREQGAGERIRSVATSVAHSNPLHVYTLDSWPSLCKDEHVKKKTPMDVFVLANVTD